MVESRNHSRVVLGLVARASAFVVLASTALYASRSTSTGRALHEWMNLEVAHGCAALLRVLGFDVVAEGTYIYTSSYSVVIVEACNGLRGILMLVCACVTLPVSWPRRFVGALAAIPLAVACNQLRLVTVMIVGSRWPQHIEQYETVIVRAAHWTILLTAFAWWASRSTRRQTVVCAA